MNAPPPLETERLLLRPFADGDSPTLTALLNAPGIAANMISIPQPYTEFDALAHIAASRDGFAYGAAAYFAVVNKAHGNLLGEVMLDIERSHKRAELGYWLGKPSWGRGYMGEAVGAVLHYGFETLALARIYARAFARNSASTRLLEKAGFQHEGTLRRHTYKDGAALDVAYYGLLRAEYTAS